MHELSTFRINVLRAYYALIFVGLAIQIWPLLVHVPLDTALMKTVVRSVLTAVSLLAALGIRYPVKMLPLLMFELLWKLIWVLVFGLPLWLGHALDAESSETMLATMMGVVLTPLALPWGYIWAKYVRSPADR